jgi:hypothetical protein
VKGFLKRIFFLYIQRDDEYEQGMEQSGCNDSKKVTERLVVL